MCASKKAHAFFTPTWVVVQELFGTVAQMWYCHRTEALHAAGHVHATPDPPYASGMFADQPTKHTPFWHGLFPGAE